MRYPFRIWAEIDLDAFSRNIQRIQSRLLPGKNIILVVKADAYGHGAVQVAEAAQASGVAMLGVGNSQEAIEIQEEGIKIPILILGSIIDEEIKTAALGGIHVGVHSSSRLALFSREALRVRRRLCVHLNIDTGMGRLGVPPGEALKTARAICYADGLEFAGIYTHFTHSSYPPVKETMEQEKLFSRVIGELRRKGVLPKRTLIHASNSGAVFSSIGFSFDAVRPGLAAYGALPCPLPGGGELEPVLSLKTQIIFYKDISKGTCIGYEGTWRAREDTRIATVPAGYNDGIPWRLGLGNRGYALLKGHRVPYAGRVSMDYLCLDIGRIHGVKIGDPVTLIGRDCGEVITVADMAYRAQTTPYEILCNMGKRVRRVVNQHRFLRVDS